MYVHMLRNHPDNRKKSSSAETAKFCKQKFVQDSLVKKKKKKKMSGVSLAYSENVLGAIYWSYSERAYFQVRALLFLLRRLDSLKETNKFV